MIRAISLVAAALVAVSAASSAQPKRYYLALGDSIAYGIQPGKVDKGLPPAKFNTGYVDVVAAGLRKQTPRLVVVNYGCPGESTVTFVRGGCPWLTEHRKLHNPFRGTQLAAALAFLKTHRGQVGPITLTLAGNDIIPAFDDCPRANFVACVKTRAPKVIGSFTARLGLIVKDLRTAAPSVPIVVTGMWNFDPDHLDFTTPLYGRLTAATKAAVAGRATFVDLIPVFNAPGSPDARRARLCSYTFICTDDDAHPTDIGYRAIAAAILRAL
jgi:lysophospholipase L1-like esterase